MSVNFTSTSFSVLAVFSNIADMIIPNYEDHNFLDGNARKAFDLTNIFQRVSVMNLSILTHWKKFCYVHMSSSPISYLLLFLDTFENENLWVLKLFDYVSQIILKPIHTQKHTETHTHSRTQQDISAHLK